MSLPHKFFSQDGLAPLGEALGDRKDLIGAFAIGDVLLALSFLALAYGLFKLTRKAKIPMRGGLLVLVAFAVFHALFYAVALWTLWEPVYWVAAVLRVSSAAAGVLAVAWVFQSWPDLIDYGRIFGRLRSSDEEQERRFRDDSFSNEQFERLLKRSVFLPIAMALILIVVLTSQITYIVQVKGEVAELTRGVTRLSALQRRFSESESAVRGFILTKNPGFLDSLAEAQSQIPIIIKTLSADAEPYPPLLRKVSELAHIHAEWLAVAQKMLEREKAGEGTRREEHLDQREKMLAAKRIFSQAVEEFIDIRDSYSEQADQATYLFILITVSLSGLVGLILAFWSRRQILVLSRSYTRALETAKELNQNLEQKVAERTRDLNEVNLALNAANQELEAFSYSVSHDLRGPLRGIDGFSRILMDEHEGQINPEGKQHLVYIREGVGKMGQLIDDLLRLSRLSKVEVLPTRFDVMPYCREAVAALAAQAPDRKVLFTGPERLELYGDANLLRILLQNLLNNAWKFTAKTAEARIELREICEPGFRGFRITDNGAGFDMAFHKKLFQAFQRLHSQHEFEGTGVGLALSKRIVQRHGGRISASGELGVGATFEVRLPDPDDKKTL